MTHLSAASVWGGQMDGVEEAIEPVKQHAIACECGWLTQSRSRDEREQDKSSDECE